MDFIIGGITPFTCIDYPGKMACVVFTQSCSLRCHYCHNPHLLDRAEPKYTLEYFYDFLKDRVGFLEGVVFSGGEPFMQPGLYNVIKYVKTLGFAVAVHTSGVHVEALEHAISFIDWIGFDIKAMPEDYPQITQVAKSGEKAYRSLMNILRHNIPYEVRTTVYPYFFTRDKIFELALYLKKLRVKKYVLQEYRSVKSSEVFPKLKEILNKDDIIQLKQIFGDDSFHIRFNNSIM